MPLSDLHHIPKFSYDVGPTVLTLTYPMEPFTPTHDSVGGARFAASGAGASYVVRRDRDLALRLRAMEDELDDVVALIEWAQGLASFTFWPTASEAGTSYSVLLVAPLMGERWEPRRRQDFPHMWLVDVRLRKADGSRWTDRYFTE